MNTRETKRVRSCSNGWVRRVRLPQKSDSKLIDGLRAGDPGFGQIHILPANFLIHWKSRKNSQSSALQLLRVVVEVVKTGEPVVGVQLLVDFDRPLHAIVRLHRGAYEALRSGIRMRDEAVENVRGDRIENGSGNLAIRKNDTIRSARGERGAIRTIPGEALVVAELSGKLAGCVN